MDPNGIGQTGFYLGHRIGMLAASLLLAAAVLELVRRGWLKERYALLWIAAAAGGLVVGLFPSLIPALSAWLQFQYLTIAFVACFLFLLALVLAFSVVISRLSERNRDLAQELALLEARIAQLERRHE